LPLKKNQKIFLLGVTNGEDRNFVSRTFKALCGQAAKYRSGNFRRTLDRRRYERGAKKSGEADVVLAGLFGRVRSGAKNSVGIPEAGAKVLRELLQSGKHVVNISFGNPYLLNNFPEMKTYVSLTAICRVSSAQPRARF
jgi:hypothetical protein